MRSASTLVGLPNPCPLLHQPLEGTRMERAMQEAHQLQEQPQARQRMRRLTSPITAHSSAPASQHVHQILQHAARPGYLRTGTVQMTKHRV